MAYQDGSSKEYAPGVALEGDNSYTSSTNYSGKAQALINCGLIKPEWLPGVAGNGKTSQCVVFFPDGTARLLTPRSQFKSYDDGHGGVRITKSGDTYRVRRYWTREEEFKKDAEKQEAKSRETWLAAKEAATQPDLPLRWKDGVLHHIRQAEMLIEGRMVFTDFPDIGLAENDIESAKRMIADLKNLLSWVTPTIKNKVQARSNVFSLNDAAFRNMRKH